MNDCIIFQSKNQQKRLLPWILYHKFQGFDKFVYFDDFSEDDSVQEAQRIAKKYNIDVSIFNTDNIGDKINYEQTQNSNSYGGNSSINFRIVRSYNRGIDFLKSLKNYENNYVAFLDVDEFLVTNESRKINEIIRQINSDHLYVHSFDIKPDFNLNDFYINDEKTKYRWCENSRKQTEFFSRGKSIIKLNKLIRPLEEKSNIVHVLYETGYINCDYDSLRIHHFRIPCLSNNISFIEDNTLINKAKEIVKYYDL